MPIANAGSKPGLKPWVYIAVAAVLVIFLISYLNKNATLADLRRRCIETFKNEARCECMTEELGKRTYTLSYLPLLRRFTTPSQHKLEVILKEAAMACVKFE